MKMMKFSEQGTQRQAELNYKKPPVNHDQYYWLSFADGETGTNDCDNFLLAKKHAVPSATVEVLREEWKLYVSLVYCILWRFMPQGMLVLLERKSKILGTTK